MRLNIAVLASHGGSNLQEILDACNDGRLRGQVCVVISNNSKSMALERARARGVPTIHLSSHTHPIETNLDQAICDVLVSHNTDFIFLAGYMRKIGPITLGHYPRRILNTHPSLLPLYGGQGMYGDKVHASVLAAGEKVTGVSVHLVDGEYDHGPLVAQREVAVHAADTVETLRKRVLECEHGLVVQVLARLSNEETELLP